MFKKRRVVPVCTQDKKNHNTLFINLNYYFKLTSFGIWRNTREGENHDPEKNPMVWLDKEDMREEMESMSYEVRSGPSSFQPAA